ncbi:MAG: thioredoxin family protein [Ignavibacteriae bacterium]|nr:thioredoxin family protein [Ignavibacteriota bacterium]
MKNSLIILLLVSSTIFSQENKIVEDTRTLKPMLIGNTTREAFMDTNFAWWYNSEYTNYEVNKGRLASHIEKINDKSMKIVMGTWCSDSRREVPRMLKVLDMIGFPKEKISIVNVDRKKNGVSDEVDDLNIELVPTFILYDDKTEIGRIIETPEETLEKDLVRIVE